MLILIDSLIEAALVTLETGAILENDANLAPWAWYAGTYQQYHTVILLLSEVYKTPHLAESDRIWSMINHVFGESNGINKSQRCGDILRKLKEGLESMYAMRKVKAFAELSRKNYHPDSEFGNCRSATAPSAGPETQNLLNLSGSDACPSNSATFEAQEDFPSSDILGISLQADAENDWEERPMNSQWLSQDWVNINPCGS